MYNLPEHPLNDHLLWEKRKKLQLLHHQTPQVFMQIVEYHTRNVRFNEVNWIYFQSVLYFLFFTNDAYSVTTMLTEIWNKTTTTEETTARKR